LNPRDANADGLALKKMIAAGRACAAALSGRAGILHTHHGPRRPAGRPTGAFEQRQEWFTWLLADVLQRVRTPPRGGRAPDLRAQPGAA
jgi:hypothetical protein